MINDSTQYIARISHGKDSLKMLQVIKSRGLPLDRITTTDVWATDNISARLPPMEEFVAQMDQKIWDMHHIEVEHLCAQNPDGTKKTYEQMFYHIPKRKNAGGGTVKGQLKDSLELSVSTGVKNSKSYPTRIQGFPAQTSSWCKKLKIDFVKTPFPVRHSRGARKEISWNTSESPPTSLLDSDNLTTGSVRHWLSSALMRIYAASIASMPVYWGLHTKPPAGMAVGSAIIKVWISSDFCG